MAGSLQLKNASMGSNYINQKKSLIKFVGFSTFSSSKVRANDTKLHESSNKKSFLTAEVFVGFLQGCTNKISLAEGKQVHTQVVKAGLSLGNHLLHMYAKCQCAEDARRVFDKIQVRNSYSWNTIIAVYAQCGNIALASSIFNEMPAKNEFSWNAMTDGYIKCRNLEDARKLFDEMPQRNIFSWNMMIAGYVKCGIFEVARELFDKMPERDTVSWNAMIAGYAKNGLADQALTLYWERWSSGFGCLLDLEQGKTIHVSAIKIGLVSDAFVESALDMYAKCRCIEDAQQFLVIHVVEFDKMPERNVFSWNAMVGGYAQNGHGEEAVRLWRQMQSTSIKMNNVTFVDVLSACASLAVLEQGRQIHGHVIRSGFVSDVVVGSALLDMYSKCGSVKNAWQHFEEIPQRDLISWNSMITAYAQNGYGKEALQIFEQMLQVGMKANHITFIGVLSGCNHASLVGEGCRYFDSRSRDYFVTPIIEHYSCMVDILGRAGHLDKVLDLIKNLPFEPNATVWGALLGACRVNGNTKLGKQVAECLFKLEPESPGPYVLLSNIYSAAGMWEDAAKIRNFMKERGVNTKPAYSWTEVNNKVHIFYVGDRSNPEREEIYATLERLATEMKLAGYIPDTNFALHDVEDEYKEHLLLYHSEKLAVAFGLIRTPPGTPIRIFKNLRVCGDCHTAIKLISSITGREIVVRDAIRFHHFREDTCSCGDYW
ncbi:pentatricopeptide repeat-containing protein At4g02750-like [Cryptomeria japonica]|uniref:pentatricopeptide repeat-containing protein At4g02750-like n=1 Tax=Cryptomeria japonica TaxID=3369 RepID=UPI0027DA8819|nr:pentatricopeptide repeat-containing protein At4g02750-like [Cryptomeria japonica]